MAKIVIVGNLGNDADVRELDNGQSVINFSVAENLKKLNKTTGEERMISQWYKCSYFVRNTSIAQYLKKGKRFVVFGKLEVEKFESKNTGNVDVSLNVVVENIEFAHTDSESRPSSDANTTGSSNGADNDLPF
ncbi:single-stranded DNA-binding protein [Bacteroidales bacterium OttesenSCG-928-C03]|nr:single-stranded DNA-binding protein [Bacteroidales bacterium OttesenSCG-928-C03]MDL2326155.1 single-stranded DNA-binding protein [Bacteroidales bacterium OttesenSCG-928-A14]